MTVDTLLLWLHVGFIIFAIGPLTVAIMSTPRYIRKRDLPVLRFLNRSTRIYGLLSLLAFLTGLVLARGRFDEFWLSASMTLFVVAIVLLFAIVEPDQRRAIRVLEEHDAKLEQPGSPQTPVEEAAKLTDEPRPGDRPTQTRRPHAVADVETGRIGAVSAVIGAIWLIILGLMVAYS